MSVPYDRPSPYLSYGLRLLRVREWWDKLLHLAGSSFLLRLHAGLGVLDVRAFALYIAGVLCLLIGGYAINEAADFPQDRMSGREGGLIPHREHSLLVAVAALILGLLFLHTATGKLLPRLATWGTLVIGLEYSLPPMRFKERGIWGVIIGAMAQRPALFLIFVAMLGFWNWLGAVLTVWLFCGGMLGMLGHQIVDCPNDRAAGVRTFVTQRGARPAMFLCMICAVVIGITVMLPLFLVPFAQAAPVAGVLAALSSVYAGKGLRALGKLRSDNLIQQGDVVSPTGDT